MSLIFNNWPLFVINGLKSKMNLHNVFSLCFYPSQIVLALIHVSATLPYVIGLLPVNIILVRVVNHNQRTNGPVNAHLRPEIYIHVPINLLD